jgi:hypothetical protein
MFSRGHVGMGDIESNEFFQLGCDDRVWDLPKYKFQDPYLQELYDKGWDHGTSVRETFARAAKVGYVGFRPGARFRAPFEEEMERRLSESMREMVNSIRERKLRERLGREHGGS